MKIQTFSIVAGSAACNARCPFCVSKMTPPNGVEMREPDVNWDRFDIASSLALKGGCTTAMITSKGEPTLFPGQVSRFIRRLGEFRGQFGERGFPIIEMQTNGIPIWERRAGEMRAYVRDWAALGLTTVAISVVHFDAESNRRIYLPYKKEYIDLAGLIGFLHEQKLAVRLAVVMVNELIDTPSDVNAMIHFAKTNGVEQLSFRPVNRPDESEDGTVAQWTAGNFVSQEHYRTIMDWVGREGAIVGRLGHGATIYDVGGQNVCMTNSLTLNPDSEELRQLIFFPDGAIRWDWRYPGARLL